MVTRENPVRRSEFALIIGFLTIVAAVPVTQTILELSRGERVQATDVFRYPPTAKNLRHFEKTLAEKSAFQQALRPRLQRILFDWLGDAGAQAIPGRDHWLFYRPDLRFLVEPDRLETADTESRWVPPSENRTRQDSVAQAIVRFRDQLRARGIQLLVVPVPGKPGVYPDQLTRRAAAANRTLPSPTAGLLERLRRQQVAVVDLNAEFRTRRTDPAGPSHAPLYLAQDTHWTPLGAAVAAQAVARTLNELGWAPPATFLFQTRSARVQRWGDIVDMIQAPGLREHFRSELVECEQVVDPSLGLMVPSRSDRPGSYRCPGSKSSVLVLGDSFSRIYQFAEPQSLGELVVANPASAEGALSRPSESGQALSRSSPSTAAGAVGAGSKRLLPGSAGFIAHLALALKSPVDAIVSDGGASSDVRKKLSTYAEILEGKRVVIWEFVERDIALGRPGWDDVPLPPELGR